VQAVADLPFGVPGTPAACARVARGLSCKRCCLLPYYRPDEEVVTIVCVLHSARDLAAIASQGGFAAAQPQRGKSLFRLDASHHCFAPQRLAVQESIIASANARPTS